MQSSPIYKCPRCAVESSMEEWHEATKEIYGDEIYGLDEHDSLDCVFVCPECEEESYGYRIING